MAEMLDIRGDAAGLSRRRSRVRVSSSPPYYKETLIFILEWPLLGSGSLVNSKDTLERPVRTDGKVASFPPEGGIIPATEYEKLISKEMGFSIDSPRV